MSICGSTGMKWWTAAALPRTTSWRTSPTATPSSSAPPRSPSASFAGYDGVDLAAAREHGVLVCTAGGANAISVAELTIFYMLYCSRNFKKVQKLYLEDYRQAKMGVPKTELEGKTLGLVGLGNIGKLVAKKAALT